MHYYNFSFEYVTRIMTFKQLLLFHLLHLNDICDIEMNYFENKIKTETAEEINNRFEWDDVNKRYIARRT